MFLFVFLACMDDFLGLGSSLQPEMSYNAAKEKRATSPPPPF